MAAIYHPGVIETAAHHDIGAPHDAVCIFHWLTPAGPPTTAELINVRTAFDTNYFTLWKKWANAGCKYKGSVVTDMGSNTGLQVTNALYTPQAGLGTGAPQGDQVAVLLSLKTALRYRGGHGRKYLPGLDGQFTANDGRTVNTSVLTQIVADWVTLTGAMGSVTIGSTAGLTPVVWHKKLKAAPNTTENVLAVVAQPIYATQRRRMRRVPRHRARVA